MSTELQCQCLTKKGKGPQCTKKAKIGVFCTQHKICENPILAQTSVPSRAPSKVVEFLPKIVAKPKIVPKHNIVKVPPKIVAKPTVVAKPKIVPKHKIVKVPPKIVAKPTVVKVPPKIVKTPPKFAVKPTVPTVVLPQATIIDEPQPQPQPRELASAKARQQEAQCAICGDYVRIRESLQLLDNYPPHLKDKDRVIQVCGQCYQECMKTCVGVMGTKNEVNCRTNVCQHEYKATNYAEFDKKRIREQNMKKMAGVIATRAQLGMESIFWPVVPKHPVGQ
jgi:hypothetical protein